MASPTLRPVMSRSKVPTWPGATGALTVETRCPFSQLALR